MILIRKQDRLASKTFYSKLLIFFPIVILALCLCNFKNCKSTTAVCIWLNCPVRRFVILAFIPIASLVCASGPNIWQNNSFSTEQQLSILFALLLARALYIIIKGERYALAFIFFIPFIWFVQKVPLFLFKLCSCSTVQL